MTSGVKVKLSGAASVELLDPKSIRLVRGSVSIDVPEQAIGFRVITPNADVVDLGTEFGVSVEDDGSTEVHVFRGVVVTRPFDGTRVVPLMEREAGLLDPVNAELQPIPLNASRFGLAEPTAPAQAPSSAPMDRLPDDARVVFLGDRMTARETHLMLINQALRPLTAQAAPKLFNAGIAFPLFFKEEDFERYVTAYRPTHAVLEFGPDIARFVRPQTPDNFEKAVGRLVDRLIDAGVEPILTTGYPYEVGMEDAQSRLDRYNDRLRSLAAERQLRLVDIDRAFRADGEQGRSYVLRKLNLPTFEGFRLAARTLLDAMGYGAFAVPTSTDPQPMPGLIERWQYRYVPDAEKLDEKSIGNVAPDETWEALSLPMEAKYSKRLADPSHAWSFQEARRGFTMGLFRRGYRVQAVADVHADTARAAAVNVGGGVETVWLNGEKVHTQRAYTGSYAGKERVPVRLRAGTNRIVVESSRNYFLSLTDAVDWPLPR